MPSSTMTTITIALKRSPRTPEITPAPRRISTKGFENSARISANSEVLCATAGSLAPYWCSRERDSALVSPASVASRRANSSARERTGRSPGTGGVTGSSRPVVIRRRQRERPANRKEFVIDLEERAFRPGFSQQERGWRDRARSSEMRHAPVLDLVQVLPQPLEDGTLLAV